MSKTFCLAKKQKGSCLFRSGQINKVTLKAE